MGRLDLLRQCVVALDIERVIFHIFLLGAESCIEEVELMRSFWYPQIVLCFVLALRTVCHGLTA